MSRLSLLTSLLLYCWMKVEFSCWMALSVSAF